MDQEGFILITTSIPIIMHAALMMKVYYYADHDHAHCQWQIKTIMIISQQNCATFTDRYYSNYKIQFDIEKACQTTLCSWIVVKLQ